MTNKERAITIVKEMEILGYHLFNETAEQFIERTEFNAETVTIFLENFKRVKGIA